MSKLLFLDIDGVLNTSASRINCYKTRGHLLQLDDDKVKLIHDLIARTGAEIVLSSDWRDDDNCLKVLNEVFEIKDKTRVPLISFRRGDEIKEFIDEFKMHNDLENFVIVDDRLDAGFHHDSNFFATNDEIGLTKEIADSIIFKLKERSKP